MINGFYAAKSGAKNFQVSLDVTSNNIANVNSEGYKAQTVTFADLVYTRAQGLEVPVGNGVRAVTTSGIISQGAYREDRLLSAVISGDGYYSVQNADQTTSYTRAGSFALSVDGEKTYLATGDGEYILNVSGQRIEVDMDNVTATFEQIALYSFQNPGALTAQGNAKYAPNAASGDAVQDTKSQLVVSVAEQSNVNLIDEMSKMITAQRGFQFNARMIQTADEIEQIANTLRT